MYRITITFTDYASRATRTLSLSVVRSFSSADDAERWATSYMPEYNSVTIESV
jgi:hypothetical protein